MKKITFEKLKFLAASHEDKMNPANLKKILFSKKDFSLGRVQMINWSILKAGRKFQPHYHEDMEEIFILISGSVTMEVGKKIQFLHKGDAVLVPTGSIHSMENMTDIDIEYIVVGISGMKNGKTIIVE